MLTNFNAACVYKQHPNGVYEISIREVSRQGVQEFFQQLSVIYDEATAAKAFPVRSLVHAPASSTLPIVSLATELHKWSGQISRVPARCAVIYNGAFGGLVDILARNAGYRNVALRVFGSAYQDEAVAWLFQDA
jgi:hypothetical protein